MNQQQNLSLNQHPRGPLRRLQMQLAEVLGRFHQDNPQYQLLTLEVAAWLDQDPEHRLRFQVEIRPPQPSPAQTSTPSSET